MGIIKYKGYIVRPVSRYLVASDQWLSNVLIKKSIETETLIHPFCVEDTFATKEKAEAAALKYGINIINGKVPDCSITELL